jgi:hypothetical protein
MPAAVGVQVVPAAPTDKKEYQIPAEALGEPPTKDPSK